jgi:hypothetical protein
MPPPFLPMGFWIEIAYTALIFVFCLMVYFKTKEAYDLTKHKGIQFFRYAFLFFGLAYASRLVIYLVMAGSFFDVEAFPPFRELGPVSHLVTAYFSTLAILYLTFSTIWKRFNAEQFITFANIVAIFVALIAFIFHSPAVVSLTQAILLALTIILSSRSYKEHRAKMYGLYLLIAIFWVASLFLVNDPKNFLPFELKLGLQALSISVFSIIYYRVAKWTK